ncbi:phosphogluconate dehydratase [Marinicellulosiphila megalodicopiae]|uniref:phosphogluconate dehydratase n=1 Tax=Marinicellulosiphila megalodicopiae TaxID=2724896 RepID=UPI003BB06C7E
MKPINPELQRITDRIIERSAPSRKLYLDNMQKAIERTPDRNFLSCGNLAHGFAACNASDKNTIKMMNSANVAIVTSYNDMLSAHHPYAEYPQQIKQTLNSIGCTGQVAGGVPAMCDGVTQGQPGMELSLFSRDQIAMSTAISLSHNMFDGVMYLGICDKIVPGLVIGALRFGYLPSIFVPAGPMMSGLPNKEKVRIRQEYAQGLIGREELLNCESESYHSEGTCTFYGTANTNQMLMEFMGLQLSGSSFVNPGTDLRHALTDEAAKQVVRNSSQNGNFKPLFEILNEKAFVNGMVGLMVSGGSTNLTIHLIAMARAAGIIIDWHDLAEISKAVPLLAKVYPNGQADVNQFHAAGGLSYLMGELLEHGLLHNDVKTITSDTLKEYLKEPFLEGDQLVWKDGITKALDDTVLSTVDAPFSPEGGLQALKGNLGTGVIKISAVAKEHQIIEAPAVIFETQQSLVDAFKAGELNKDFIAVMRFQGPKANGMPELHQMTPPMGVLQDKGFKVALVTDGRMSGASGKVPAGIHMSPEASEGGPLGKIQDGDMIRFDATTGDLNVLMDEAEFAARPCKAYVPGDYHQGVGREMFSGMRDQVSEAQLGASIFKFEIDELEAKNK